MTTRYTVIESKRWQHKDGRTASLYGAVPYTSDTDKANWQIVVCGWTLYNNQTGAIGTGRTPYNTIEEAKAVADRLNGVTP